LCEITYTQSTSQTATSILSTTGLRRNGILSTIDRWHAKLKWLICGMSDHFTVLSAALKLSSNASTNFPDRSLADAIDTRLEYVDHLWKERWFLRWLHTSIDFTISLSAGNRLFNGTVTYISSVLDDDKTDADWKTSGVFFPRINACNRLWILNRSLLLTFDKWHPVRLIIWSLNKQFTSNLIYTHETFKASLTIDSTTYTQWRNFGNYATIQGLHKTHYITLNK